MNFVPFPREGLKNVPLLKDRQTDNNTHCECNILLSRSSESCLQHNTDPTSGALDNSNSLFHDNANLGGGGGGGGGMGRRPLDLTSSLRAKPDLIETTEQRGSSRDSNK